MECDNHTIASHLNRHQGIATAPKSGHGHAMFDIGQKSRVIAMVVMTLLVAASTIVPSVSYAQKYGEHLSQYGGYDARAAAISGFAALYLSPDAPMLPVVLSANSDVEFDAVIPTSCSMDKTVLPTGIHHSAPCEAAIAFLAGDDHPVGLDQPATRGPPRPRV